MSTASTGSLVDGIDVAYLLVQRDDWTTGMRGNRWHWARRWAQRVPTVVVEPTRGRIAAAGPGPAVPNLRVLRVEASTGSALRVGRALDQAGRIAVDIERHGFERPLLWSWNPQMAIPFGAIPAAARVYHATENYFDMGLPEEYLRQLRLTASIADLVVAVSQGVADGLAAHARLRGLAVVTNGVDYGAYAGAAPDQELRETARGFPKVAIYAGNVNSKLDLELLDECAARFDDTMFALYGRVQLLDSERAGAWEALLARPNAAFLGEVSPDRLPALYAAADVGLIPYTSDPLIVDNGFPLKLLEMAAAGLPVVSTYMRCVVGLAGALVVAETSEEFVRALGERLLRGVTPGELAELDRVSRQNDYDVKFEEALVAIDERLEAVPEVSVRLDAVLGAAADQWRKALRVRVRRVRPAPAKERWGSRLLQQARKAPGRRLERLRRGLLPAGRSGATSTEAAAAESPGGPRPRLGRDEP